MRLMCMCIILKCNKETELRTLCLIIDALMVEIWIMRNKIIYVGI